MDEESVSGAFVTCTDATASTEERRGGRPCLLGVQWLVCSELFKLASRSSWAFSSPFLLSGQKGPRCI